VSHAFSTFHAGELQHYRSLRLLEIRRNPCPIEVRFGRGGEDLAVAEPGFREHAHLVKAQAAHHRTGGNGGFLKASSGRLDKPNFLKVLH
jgi:hypothetical protein